MKYPVALENLIESLGQLPSIGPRAAKKLSFFLLSQSQDFLNDFSENIATIKQNIAICKNCFCLQNTGDCLYCDNCSREQDKLCIIEERENVLVIEDYSIFQGMYHVLEGALSPINGVYPENLRIEELLVRIQNKNFAEIIIATNPTIEGVATSQYLLRLLNDKPIKITRLACGIPSGGDIKYTDKATLGKAFQDRQKFTF